MLPPYCGGSLPARVRWSWTAPGTIGVDQGQLHFDVQSWLGVRREFNLFHAVPRSTNGPVWPVYCNAEAAGGKCGTQNQPVVRRTRRPADGQLSGCPHFFPDCVEWGLIGLKRSGARTPSGPSRLAGALDDWERGDIMRRPQSLHAQENLAKFIPPYAVEAPAAAWHASPGSRLALTTLPLGFSDFLVDPGGSLSSPTAMDFSPIGDCSCWSKAVHAKLVRNDGTTHTAVTLSVDSAVSAGCWASRLIPTTTAPVRTTTIFISTTHRHPGGGDPVNNQVSRSLLQAPAGRRRLYRRHDRPRIAPRSRRRRYQPQRRRIHFGLDGKLYVAVGDHNYDTAPSPTTSRNASIRLSARYCD